jgi:hypothetical protein
MGARDEPDAFVEFVAARSAPAPAAANRSKETAMTTETTTKRGLMRTWKPRTAIAVAAVTLVAGVVDALVTTGASGAPVVHHRSFIATQIYRTSTTGPGGEVGGTGFVSSEVERHKGTVIGTDSVTGTFNFGADTTTIYVAVAWKRGALVVAGQASPTTPFVGKIVRGTGKYAGATGTVTTRNLPHGQTAVKVAYTLK